MASPFELLLNVCNLERMAMDAERHAAQEAKKLSRKHHTSSEPLSFKEIKSLSPKALVQKYAKLISDEMNKKYSYQCRLFPGKCHEIFKSFGNERKAWEKMKLHLATHLKDYSFEMDVSLYAKSPSEEEKLICSRALQKSPKKPKLEPHLSSGDSHLSYDPARQMRRVESCPAKKMLEFNGGATSKPASKRKKYTPKPKSQLVIRNLSLDGSVDYPLPLNEQPIRSSRVSFSSSGSEQDDESRSSLASCSSFVGKDWKTDNSCLLPGTVTHPQDHDYAEVSRYDYAVESDEDSCIFWSQKKPRRRVQKQFIITTPKFPYLHDPVEFVVTEIAEIDELGNQVRAKQHDEVSCLDINRYVTSRDEKKPPSGELSFFVKCQARDVTGTVLECVENKFRQQSTAARFKCSPSTSNDENSENVQRAHKEIAMRHIAQLNSKRKKSQAAASLECQLCMDGRQFTAVASLAQHYRGHAGIKLFVCSVCNDTFTRQHSLNYHMMIHQNQSRFCCDFCQRTFRHPSHYREHLRRHTGETPFDCPACATRFKTRNTLRRHLRAQHGIQEGEGGSSKRGRKDPHS